ncbi:MAG: serine hydrolase domain-containing protein [Promethearchaeota archaeon]
MIPPQEEEQNSETYWPTTEWVTVSPKEQNLSSFAFQEIYNYIQRNSLNIHSVLILRNNYIVNETYLENCQIREEKKYSPNHALYNLTLHPSEEWYYANDWNDEPRIQIHNQTAHELWSATKSITSLLTGIAIDKGYLTGVNQTLFEFFSDIWNSSIYGEEKKNITIHQLLTMTSGIYWGNTEEYTLEYTENWIDYMLSRPMENGYNPGEYFNYDSGLPQLISVIIETVTGQKMSEFARENLFEPLGISENEWVWEEDPYNISVGGWALCMSPRALSKIGILCLNNGTWNGTEIISADWLEKSTTNYCSDLPASWAQGSEYGYYWWLNTADEWYSASGMLGQCLYILPTLNMAVVFTAEHSSLISYHYGQIINLYIKSAIL